MFCVEFESCAFHSTKWNEKEGYRTYGYDKENGYECNIKLFSRYDTALRLAKWYRSCCYVNATVRRLSLPVTPIKVLKLSAFKPNPISI